MAPALQTIHRFMSHPVLTVPRDASMSACAELMARADHRHLPVTDSDGRVTGMVTDRALMALELFFSPQQPEPDGNALLWNDARAHELAVNTPMLFSPDAPAALVLRALSETRQDTAILVDGDGLPQGIFTDHDVATMAAEALDAELTTEDLVRQPLVAVGPSQPVRLARVLMNASNARHVLVVDEDGLKGVLSWRDLARRGFLRGYREVAQDLDTPTGALIGREPVTVPIGTSLRAVAQLLVDERVGCVPVLDGQGVPVSLISRADFIPILAARLHALAA